MRLSAKTRNTGRHLHVIGGGLSGLACAVEAVRRGARVSLYEAAPQAGGRCRSYHDPHLDRVIDTASHLILSANKALLGLLRQCGAEDRLVRHPARFPFVDLSHDRQWCLQPNTGPLPWWLWSKRRRCPDVGLADHLRLLGMGWASPQSQVSDWSTSPTLHERLLVPLSKAILNSPPEAASARLLGQVLKRTLARGGDACAPLLAPHGLSEAIITPLVRWLTSHGATLHFCSPIRHLGFDGPDRLAHLDGPGGRVALGNQDRVVLALPQHRAHALLEPDADGSAAPIIPKLDGRSITAVHFRLPAGCKLPWQPVYGVLGGTAEWLFWRDDVVSVTISDAPSPDPKLVQRLWSEICHFLTLQGDLSCAQSLPVPPHRLLHHQRATHAQDPASLASRDAVLRHWETRPLTLAGDWTVCHLPATLEAAVLSGTRAAHHALIS